jgi:NAD(P)-dependent dehydrogenase (short-subunit alcohol dehydrogenase family)
VNSFQSYTKYLYKGLGIQPITPLNTYGIDPIFTTNCIGHQILTTLLLPLLKRATSTSPTGTARIVVSSSSLHQLCRTLNLSHLTRPTRKWPAIYDSVWRYARSKLGNILFTKELSRRLLEDEDPASKMVYVNSYFPGNVVTQQWQGWSEHLGSWIGACIRWLGKRFGQSVEEAAATAVYLAASPEVSEMDSRGQYYVPIAKVEEPTRLGRDEVLGRQLWVCFIFLLMGGGC